LAIPFSKNYKKDYRRKKNMKSYEKICALLVLGVLAGVSMVPLFSGELNNGTTSEIEDRNSVQVNDNALVNPSPELELIPYDDPNYKFAVTQTTIRSFFAEELTTGSGIKFTTTSTDGEDVEVVYEPMNMILQGDEQVVSQVEIQKSKGTFSGNTVTYRELYPDVDFEFIVQAGKVKHNIIINNKPNVIEGINTEGLTLEFSGMLWFSDGIYVHVGGEEQNADFKTQEAIDLCDSSGRVLFTIPPPITNDNHKIVKWIRSQYAVSFAEGGIKISVGTPAEWLLNAQYPVTVDPTIMGAEFVVDAKSNRDHRILDATWHAATGQFLTVWSELPDPDGSDEIRGQLINLDSTLSGGDFLISEPGGDKDFPQILHILDTVRPAQQLSFVVWMDSRDGDWDIWGQLIAPAGNALQGTNFKLSGADVDLFPNLAYAQISWINGRFLVVWERETAVGESEVYGQMVLGAATGGSNPGDLSGGNFQISDTMAGRGAGPSVAFDPVNDQFLVVWADDRGGVPEEREIWGQRVDINGADVGGNFLISAQSGYENAPLVEYHPEQAEYLVVWNRDPSFPSPSDVHAQRVSPAGALLGGRIDVAVTGQQEACSDFAIDRDTGSYVIPLNTGPSVGNRIKVEMQKIDRNGALVGTRDQIATDVLANKGPIAAVYGSTPIGPGAGVAAVSEVLFVWRDKRSGFMDVYGRMVEVKQDSDGDGLLDNWETNGWVDMNDNGVLDAGDFDFSTLPAANQPDVDHKDLYVEVDWMQLDADGDGIVVGDIDSPGDHVHPILAGAPGSTPTGTSWDNVIAAFQNAPVTNPDGVNGINLHVDVGQMGGGSAIPETLNVNFYAAASLESVKLANFNPNRQLVFRYALVKHEGSGAGEIWGNDFWIGDQYNTVVMQGTGFMHELGHTLGLRHGGGDNIHCKPNYFSIMSYTHQLAGVPPTFSFNYSSEVLPPLDESNLNEAVTLGDGGDQTIFKAGGFDIGPNANTAGNVPIDWDQDGILGESGAAVTNNNINNIVVSGGSVVNEVLNGFNDWANIRYNFRSSPNFDDGVHSYYQEDEDQTVNIDFIRTLYGEPTLSVSMSGTTAGIPGDPVTYDIIISNAGPGPARNLVVTDTWPAGLTLTGTSLLPVMNTLNADGSRTLVWNIQLLQAGNSVTITLEGTIDYPPTGSFATGDVLVTGQNVLGESKTPIMDSVTTDILYPDIQVIKTTTPSVNAGEIIEIAIDYENVGTADAEDVVIVDTLPPEVFYMAGSASSVPDSVIVNLDDTTTMTWSIGTVAPSDGGTITFDGGTSLLLIAPDILENAVEIAFEDANDNPYSADTTASTDLTEVTPTEEVHTLGWWKNKLSHATDEQLAMIQRTDNRYDLNTDGVLTFAEAEAALEGIRPRERVDHLRSQLFATYLNLATRAYNAGTVLSDTLDGKIAKLGLDFANIQEGVLFARDVLAMPLDKSTDFYYVKAFTVLAQMNTHWVFA
jgi:uncharacterized repeat protein (TIGR01451 family)